jgi:hypothetical protein
MNNCLLVQAHFYHIFLVLPLNSTYTYSLLLLFSVSQPKSVQTEMLYI